MHMERGELVGAAVMQRKLLWHEVVALEPLQGLLDAVENGHLAGRVFPGVEATVNPDVGAVLDVEDLGADGGRRVGAGQQEHGLRGDLEHVKRLLLGGEEIGSVGELVAGDDLEGLFGEGHCWWGCLDRWFLCLVRSRNNN